MSRGQFDGAFRSPGNIAMEKALLPPPPDQSPWIGVTSGNKYVHWRGIFRGLSGYAKANREIVLRIANTFRVSADLALDCPDHDEYLSGRLEFYKRVAVPTHAPSIRFFGPAVEPADPRRHRVLWTMMETECVHPMMIGLMNEHYNECWVPTKWNIKTFTESGLQIPVRQMPLGIDPHIYSPGPRRVLPAAKLITTESAGRMEIPTGFLWMYCFLPSWRKGVDILLPAFEEAFKDDPNVGLVLNMTHSTLKEQVTQELYHDMKSRVWVLKGNFTEWEMAELYRSVDAYVCTSRGEGWNLPAMEAAACGIPAVLPDHSSHPELFGEHCPLFEREGVVRCPDSEVISPWYKDMAFSLLGDESKKSLTKHLQAVRGDYEAAKERAAVFSAVLRKHVTWDVAAQHVAERLLEIQP